MADSDITRKLNELLAALGATGCHCVTGSELLNEAIVAGTVSDTDTSDEFVFGIRLHHCGGAPFDVYAEHG